MAESWVMPPSRPMDAPVPMLTSEDMNFTIPLRRGNLPSPATTTSSRLVDLCCPTNRKPQCGYQARRQTAKRRKESALPWRNHLRDFNRIARSPEEKPLHVLNGVVVKQVDQPANDADTTRKREMERLFAQLEFLTKPNAALPMAAEIGVRPSDNYAVRPSLHDAKSNRAVCFDESGVDGNSRSVGEFQPRSFSFASEYIPFSFPACLERSTKTN